MQTQHRFQSSSTPQPLAQRQQGIEGASFVKDLTVEQLQTLIRVTVEDLLLEFLGDPDAGLTFKAEVKAQLLQQQQQRLAGQRGLSTAELMQQLELD